MSEVEEHGATGGMAADATLRRVAELTQGSARIAAPPAAIMAVIADVAAYPEWAEGVRDAGVVAVDAVGRPDRAAFRVGMAGIEAAYTLAYTYAPDEGGVSWTYRIGTRVPWRTSVASTGCASTEPRRW